MLLTKARQLNLTEVNEEVLELFMSFSLFLGSFICLVRSAPILLNVYCAVEHLRSV